MSHQTTKPEDRTGNLAVSSLHKKKKQNRSLLRKTRPNRRVFFMSDRQQVVKVKCGKNLSIRLWREITVHHRESIKGEE